jgi:hypothetical protein
MKMKKINWIIEKNIFEDYEFELYDIIKNRKNCNVILIDDSGYDFNFNKSIKNKYEYDDIVIFYGSLQLGRRILKETSFIPGIFLTLDNYEVFNYYGHYGDHMINNDYILIGLNDVLRNKEKIFNYFKTNKIFIRPSNGFKTFTGQLLPYDNFEFEFNVLKQSYGGLDNQLVMISSEKKVIDEYRFIIVDGKLIDGSLYMKNGIQFKEKIKVDDDIIDYVNYVIKLYSPDLAYTIDICKNDKGEYKVLEIGTFCCASLYNCDLNKIVDSINELCVKEYNDYYNIE